MIVPIGFELKLGPGSKAGVRWMARCRVTLHRVVLSVLGDVHELDVLVGQSSPAGKPLVLGVGAVPATLYSSVNDRSTLHLFLKQKPIATERVVTQSLTIVPGSLYELWLRNRGILRIDISGALITQGHKDLDEKTAPVDMMILEDEPLTARMQ